MTYDLSITSLSKSKFDSLAKYRDLYCISIFLPHVLKGKNPLEKIKENLLSKAKNSYLKREVQGMNLNSIQEHIREIKPLVIKWDLTTNDSNIAIFISNNTIDVFEIKRTVPFKIYTNDHFYLKFFAQNFNSENTLAKNYLTNKKIEKVISEDVQEIIRLSAKGDIKVLFLEKDKDLFGELDEENDYVLPFKDETSGTSLSNIAAIHTILNNGNVFILEKEDMPDSSHSINAIINK